jgi:hypothetical protein
MRQGKFPRGWDEERVRRVLEHNDARSDEEAVAEDEAACLSKSRARSRGYVEESAQPVAAFGPCPPPYS